MDYINIPLPDFSFADIAKDKAQNLAKYTMHIRAISQYMQGHKTYEFESKVKGEFNSLSTNSDKLIFISELLNHLNQLIVEVNSYQTGPDERIIKAINKVKYFIYSLLTEIGYNLDTNTFDQDEVNDLNSKVDIIIDILSKLQLGQEIVFDEISSLKSDFESLKSDFILGKKRWYQRAAGIVVSYAGEKGADAVFEQLKPALKILLKQSPEFIDRLLN